MTKTTAWDKFVLLSWKNWLIQFRHPIQTAFEVLIPICVCAFLILIRGLVDVSEMKEATHWNPISVNESFYSYAIFHDTVNRRITYSPKSPILDEIMNEVVNKINSGWHSGGDGWSIENFENATLLEGDAIAQNPFVSVEFDEILSGATELPDEIHYAMRFPAELRTPNGALNSLGGFTNNWQTNIRFGLEFLPGPRNPGPDDGGEPPGYLLVSRSIN